MGRPRPAVRAGLRGGCKGGSFLNRPQMCKLEGREGENLRREMKRGETEQTREDGEEGRRGKAAEAENRVIREEKCLGWEDWGQQDGCPFLPLCVQGKDKEPRSLPWDRDARAPVVLGLNGGNVGAPSAVMGLEELEFSFSDTCHWDKFLYEKHLTRAELGPRKEGIHARLEEAVTQGAGLVAGRPAPLRGPQAEEVGTTPAPDGGWALLVSSKRPRRKPSGEGGERAADARQMCPQDAGTRGVLRDHQI